MQDHAPDAHRSYAVIELQYSERLQEEARDPRTKRLKYREKVVSERERETLGREQK